MILQKIILDKVKDVVIKKVAKKFKLDKVIDYVEKPNDADKRIDKLEKELKKIKKTFGNGKKKMNKIKGRF